MKTQNTIQVRYLIRSWNGFDVKEVTAEKFSENSLDHGKASHCRYGFEAIEPVRSWKDVASAEGIEEAREVYKRLVTEGVTKMQITRNSCGKW